ncbi:formylglycine-generating enzyme family protein [Motiliproteus sp. SC1-56]|uniref:formylglycine-generating enzyme family protein n=1 Tax=Motiliproteus sp. SC1-56 TaxID=2799565 RepID=UPI001A8FD1D8|nr:formylglycine-generating enzyme family protein [Motiliproteus sp. SC1-56]
MLGATGSAWSAVAAWADPLTGQRFLKIDAGCFSRGNPDALEADRSDYQLTQLGFNSRPFADEAPVHRTCLDTFWIAQTEVTAAQWQRVMNRLPPAGAGQQPAAGISWQQAQNFIQTLNAKAAPERYRLPTEAEWEYACQLGFPEGPPKRRGQYRSLAWYNLLGHRVDAAQEVATLSADQLGLFDMLGNVWEWTQDTYDPEAYIDSPRYQPTSTKPTGTRVIRGGSYRSQWRQVRCRNRASYPERMDAVKQLGLRLVREP